MILTDTKNLGKWSNSIISVLCDNCRIEKNIKYKLYTSYGYENGEYLCRSCKMKKNNLEKWGVENVFQLDEVKEKIKRGNLEKWGVENISQNSEIKKKVKKSISILDKKIINEKRKATVLNKWGVDNISKLDSIKLKKSKTCLENNGHEYISQSQSMKNLRVSKNLDEFGVDHFFQSDDFKEKYKKTNLNRWGVENPSKNSKISDKIRVSVRQTLHQRILESDRGVVSIDSEGGIFKIECRDCNEIFEISYQLFYKRRETKTMICTLCNPVDKHQSGKEIILLNYVKSIYSGEIIQNFRSGKSEIDIYLPELKLGFEFNGVYWHSDIYKEKWSHRKKSDYFNEIGIKVFNIWEDDWDHRVDIIKSQIRNSLGLSQRIWARKCKIIEINDIKSAKSFLENNHIQGFVRSNVKLGLTYDGEIISIMTFDNLEGRKKMADGEWNINRFCNKLGYTVVGGASKLINYFMKYYNPNRIISYADADWSTGNIYQKLGFNKVHQTNPDYKYLVSGKRIHKSNFRKSKIGMGESSLDIPKIWDCGKIKFQIIRN